MNCSNSDTTRFIRDSCHEVIFNVCVTCHVTCRHGVMIKCCQGEAVYTDIHQPRSLSSSDPPVPVVTAPIRSRPSLPRLEKSFLSRPVSTEEERFISRPTKIVPSVLKLIKPSEKVIAKQLKTQPKIPASKSTVVKRPISSFKSVSSVVDVDTEKTKEDTPVYIPRYISNPH